MKEIPITIKKFKQLTKHNSLVTATLILFLMLFISKLFAINLTTSTTIVSSSYDCASSANMATIRPVTSGLWTDASIWPNGIKPTTNDDIIIPSGIDLKMVGACRAKNITVQGTLSAVNYQSQGAWIELQAQSIMVANGGLLEIGTENQPYYADKSANGVRCQITLTGNKINNSPASYKAIMVMGGGRLELHGKKRKSWTNLSTTANPGATKITLKEAIDWEVGDKIALTATGLASSSTKTWNNVDEAEVTAVSDDRRTLTLKSPLKFKHIGGSKTYTRVQDGKTWNVDIYGEVGLLSHYIKIQGKMDGNNEQTGFGGHIMLMKNSAAHVEHVELYKMGQKGILGRYPFHWHLNEDKAKGSYLRNSSVHKSFNRAVTIHGTDYVTVDGVFAYDHIGHGIFFEDGGERFNTLRNNVVFVTRRPKSGEELTPSDNQFNAPQNRTPSSYWITNPNNYFENNIAAGTEGTGFWFAFPANGALFDTGKLDYYKGNPLPWKEKLGKFKGFVAHTCMTGFDVFDQLNDDHSIKANFGWDISARQLIENGLFYGNDQAIYSGLGVNGQNKNTVFYNCAFSDNKTISMLAGDLTIENSLFNVDTDLGVFNGVREFFRFYDGPGRHIDCHFEGWNRSNAEMIKQLTGGGATENFNPTFRGTTKGFSEPFPFRFFPLPNTDATRTRKIGQFFKDYDGTFLGKPGTLIRDVAFLRDGHEYRHPSWRNAARSDYYFASLWMARINASGSRISVVRSKSGTDDVCFYESGDKSSGTYKFPQIVNKNFMYTYYFDSAPANKSILLIWNRGDAGDLGLACFKGLGKLGNFRVNGSPRLNSIAAVENATNNGYFIANNGDVYVKFRAVGGDTRVNVTLNWDHNGNFQPATLPCTKNDLDGITATDSDGDGRPDIVETETCGNPNNASDLNFAFNQTDEGFQKVNFSASNVSSNVYWLVRVDNSNDPYIVKSGLKFSGSQVPKIKIRAKSEAAGAFQLFWATTDQTGFTATRSVTVTPKTTNIFEELVFDMSNLDTWMGKTITKIRLDFPPDTSASRHTFIDYIQGPNASDTPCDLTPEIVFTSPTNSQLDEGDDLGVVISVNSGRVSNIKLYINNVLVRQEGAAPYEWGIANVTQQDHMLLDLAAGTYELKAVATTPNNKTITKTKTITVNDLANVVTIPGNFEAEAFTNISGNLQIENTPGGGQNLGFIRNSDYTNYQVNVVESGTYDLTVFASSFSNGGSIKIYSNDSLKGSLEIPNNDNWHSYQSYTTSISLAKGVQTLRLVYTGGTGYLFNIDRVQIAQPVHIEKTITLSPVHDAYLDNNARFNNTMIRLENGRRIGYLMFDLSSINGTITKADLIFNVYGDSGNGNLTINKGNTINWTENNLSNTNKPVKGIQLGSLNDSFSIGDTKKIPLNSAHISGNKISIILETLSGNDFAFASKENGTISKPHLAITYITNKDDIDASSNINLFPNPVNDILNITGLPISTHTLEIKDLQGKKVKSFISKNTTIQTMNINDIPSGVYILIIRGYKLNESMIFVKK
ncbi:T9SS C-terminal target domain-containing protein [Aquimarina sp. AD10]|uniref:carbohydrate-binding protein n=1 Tax=Aquimarina sp. AD10 TaxID=1714849 RepID=UPI000E4BEADA|nr:carbohydrate-binding protein [Aquimarina sp. AD10]AXT58946.1 T9SS C-terminal target domain-containing protein [Aquimarina sp. AD10]RKM99578.1 carbohydrate-binding protein [Aquimarina sp. AD10]